MEHVLIILAMFLTLSGALAANEPGGTPTDDAEPTDERQGEVDTLSISSRIFIYS